MANPRFSIFSMVEGKGGKEGRFRGKEVGEKEGGGGEERRKIKVSQSSQNIILYTADFTPRKRRGKGRGGRKENQRKKRGGRDAAAVFAFIFQALRTREKITLQERKEKGKKGGGTIIYPTFDPFQNLPHSGKGRRGRG